MGVHTQLLIALEYKTGTKLKQSSSKLSGKTLVKYVNYIIVISIINSLLIKIIGVRENLPKKKNKNRKTRGKLISQNSFTQSLNIQMTFKYSKISMQIMETINKSQKNLVGIPTSYKITHIAASKCPKLSNLGLN